MATLTIPHGGISLHGAPDQPRKDGSSSAVARSAILLRLNEQVIKDLQQCSDNGKVLQVLGGKSPKIRFGPKTIDLDLTPEAFRHELYTSSGASSDLTFTALVSQQGHVKTTQPPSAVPAGADAALANLKQNLASFAQEKEAKQATIASSVIQSNKGGRQSLHPHRNLLNSNDRLLSRSSSPSLNPTSTSSHLAPTSAARSNPHEAAKMAAIRKVFVHYLAIGNSSEEELRQVTHVNKDLCKETLRRIAEPVIGGGSWMLQNKAYKELDAWGFEYKTEKDRQAAIDNAIKAYDRMRLSRDDNLWQMLLQKRERGKGKILSRLHSGAPQASRSTPLPAASSPLPSTDGAGENRTSESRPTPKLGATSTPRGGAVASGKSGLSIEKRLKESKKQRVADEAKELRRKEREAADSERDVKTKTNLSKKTAGKAAVTGKFKSEEVVHSSDDEDEEVLPLAKAKVNSTNSKQSDAGTAPKSGQSDATTKIQSSPLPSGTRSKPSPSQSSGSSDAPLAARNGAKSSVLKDHIDSKEKQADAAKKTMSAKTLTAKKPVDGLTPQHTPSHGPEKNSNAIYQSAAKRQLSPQKLDSKPRVPSPLGAARSRVSSDVPDKKPNGSVTRPDRPSPSTIATKSAKEVNGVSNGATPKLSSKGTPVNGTVKKRPLEETGDDIERPTKVSKVGVNGIAKAVTTSKPQVNGNTPINSDNGLKRKANDISSGIHDHEPARAEKHQRTESSSSQSVNASSSLTNTTAGTSTTSPSVARSPVWQRSPSGQSSSSEPVRLSWERALEEAEKFRTTYYPAYLELYDRLQSLPADDVKTEDRKKLYEMHERLVQMKKEISLASK